MVDVIGTVIDNSSEERWVRGVIEKRYREYGDETTYVVTVDGYGDGWHARAPDTLRPNTECGHGFRAAFYDKNAEEIYCAICKRHEER